MKTFGFLFILSFLLFSCGKEEVKMQSQKSERRAVPVMVETVKIRTLENYIPISGRLEGSIDMLMSSETSGKVTDIYKTLGDRVEKGEELGTIDNKEYEIQLEQAKASVLAANASFQLAEITWETNDALYKKNQISKMEWIQAESSFLNAKAAVQSAKANLERAQKAYDNSILTIPVSGYIADISIQLGEYLSPGKPVAAIIETKQLKMKSGISETHIPKLKKNQLVTVTSSNSTKEWKATITGLGGKIMPGTAAYPIEIVLDNSDRTLLPGMLVHAKILSDTYQNVIYTNLNNVIKQYDDYFVFVVDEKNQAHRRKVTLGDEVADNVIIVSGLSENEQLVVEGMANLEDGSMVDVRKSAE